MTWRDYRGLLVAARQQLKAPIVVVRDNLPTHCPELNPAEGVRSMLKRRLTDITAGNLDHLTQTIKRHLRVIQYRARLIDGCLAQTGLTLEAP